MSTISKALDKQKNNPQVIMQSEKSWSMTLGIVTGIMLSLLAALIFLLVQMKPAWLMNLLDQKTQSPAPVIEQVEEKPSLVTDVTFDTKPLPIIVQDEPVKFISPEKPKRPLKVVNNAPKTALKQQISIEQEQALADVSDDLRARFAKAVAAEDKLSAEQEDERVNTVPVNDITKMPITFQFQVPLMRYDSHVYSSKESERWIRINGVDLRVGDYVGPVQLVKIMPHRSEFRLGEQNFTLESLTDWDG